MWRTSRPGRQRRCSPRPNTRRIGRSLRPASVPRVWSAEGGAGEVLVEGGVSSRVAPIRRHAYISRAIRFPVGLAGGQSVTPGCATSLCYAPGSAIRRVLLPTEADSWLANVPAGSSVQFYVV